MLVKEIMNELKSIGNEGTKKVLMRHGAREPFYGVKVEELKKIQKRIKKNYQLSIELYNTGNSDAMYLAGLIADENKMSEQDLDHWAQNAYWYMLSEYTVAWVTAESRFGYSLGTAWINSEKENIASAGWAALASLVAIKPDKKLDLPGLERLLEQAAEEINNAPNRVRYTMNGFVIAVGSYVTVLSEKAQEVAAKIDKVSVDMTGTSCKVPFALDYIQKVIKKGRLGKKRKMARC